MFIKFNNNNIWEVVDDVVFYKRVLTPQTLSTVTIDKEIDEDTMKSEGQDDKGPNFNYNDWKVFYGEEMLRKIASDFQVERYALPMIYYAIFVLGLTDMRRERSTKYVFNRR
jgi:hypothetical protein